jgi:hypothetical protein
MRSERVTAAAFAGALALVAGCSGPDSFIVVSMRSATTAAPITNIATIQVKVSKGPTLMRTLTYAAHGMTIDQTLPDETLSVGFSSDETGKIDFEIDALNNVGCSIGHGTTTQEIKKGNVAFAPVVAMVPGLNCTNVDAGAPDVPEGGTLPGCDPVNPQAVDGGVTTCMATQTCQVDCVPPMNAAPRNECIAGGTGGPGTVCNTNADCMPGTQCFNYANTGCGVKVCLRFCNGTADCAAFGAGGAGPGSFCEGPVMCPNFLTAYHTCTFNCDPRAAAAATRGGCPSGPMAGLVCVMPEAMDQVDCACAETTRTKHEGDACAAAADCAPGLLCNQMSGSKTCRAICRCDANAAGACTAPPGDCPTTGTTCRAVTNNKIYGICL